jgi:multiple sugar transport system ATP-binding protein
MGMETLIYPALGGTRICGRLNPNAGARDGGSLDWQWTSTICTC